jgi:hypothetical protein
MANPPEIPVRDFPSPEILDGLLVETWDVNKGEYKPIPVGTRYPEGPDSKYTGYELVSQKTTGDFRWVQRFWCNPASNQDLYNASIEYDGEDHTKPIFIRQYVERRPYTSIANGTKLTGVLGVTVTNGGSAYTTPPTVTLTGGAGSGATAVALLYRGVVVYVRITNEGTGYTSAPTVVFSSGSAAATAYIQSTGAVLISEKVAKLPKDDPRFGLYDLVTRVYMTLPGAVRTDYKYDPDSDTFIITDRTTKVTSTITEGITLNTAPSDDTITLIESRSIEGNTYISTEVATTWIQPVARDASTQITMVDKDLPFPFPAVMYDFPMWVDSEGRLGFRPGFTQRVPHVQKTYWVFSASWPTIDRNGAIALAMLDNISARFTSLPSLIIDGGTTYLVDLITVTPDSSTPDATTYLADWVGGAPRAAYGDAQFDGNRYRKRVDRQFIQFIIQAGPSYTP